MQVWKHLIGWMLLCLPLTNTAAPRLEEETIQQLMAQSQQLIAQRNYQTAADILERILMLAPDTEQAAEDYQRVLQLLAQQHQPHYTGTEGNAWDTSLLLGIKAGGGNNLNRGPDYQQNTLKLAKNQLPQAGYGISSYGQLLAATSLDPGTLINLQARFQHRTTNRYNFTDYINFNGAAGIQHQLKNRDQIGINASIDFIRYDNGSRFYTVDLQSRYRWRRNHNCQPQIGIDLQWQHQLGNKIFDQLYSGLHTSLHCQLSSGSYSLAIAAGQDWALYNNPGGDQTQIKLKLLHIIHNNWLVPQADFSSYIGFNYQQDQTGYSPILKNNATRRLQRISLGGRYRWPLNQHYGAWSGVFSISWQKQYSNIELFEFSALESWIGIEVIW